MLSRTPTKPSIVGRDELAIGTLPNSRSSSGLRRQATAREPGDHEPRHRRGERVPRPIRRMGRLKQR
jgi:hypothetical protein